MTQHPVYLVKGDDPALVDQALDRLVGELLGGRPRDLSLEEIALDAGAGSIVDACQTTVFLSDLRIVLARQVGRFKTPDVGVVVDYLRSPMPTTVLVMSGGGGAVATKLAKAVKEAGHVIETAVGPGKARQSWIAERCRSAPVKLTGGAVSRLADSIGEELGLLEGILDALTVAFGEGARVDEDSIVPYLGAAGSAAPWELTDAIDAGDVSTALVQLRRMLTGGDRHPLVVMATLTRHVGNLLRLDGAGLTSESEAASLLAMSPFPAKKALAQANKLGSKNILRALELTSQADVELRGNSGWPSELVLEVLVARLARLTPPRHGRNPARRAG